MATDFGSTPAKTGAKRTPTPLNLVEKDPSQQSAKHALVNGNITESSGNIAKKAKTQSPKSSSPKGHSPKGNSKTNTGSPKSNGAASSKGNITSPKGNISPKGDFTHKGYIASPKGNTVSPKGNTISPKGNIANPKGNIISPKGIITSPKGIITSPKGIITSPKGIITTPKGNITPGSHKSNTSSTKNNGSGSPKGSTSSPKTSTNSPKNGTTSLQRNTLSPKSSDAGRPKVKSSKSAPSSPRGSLLKPSSGQQKPRARSQSPKGRPQSPKGSPGSRKVKKLMENNNHGEIYSTLHVDVDLANSKLMVSPIDGRRCHSDSRISVPNTIQPSETKKRKLEFTDIKHKRSSPPGKKRRSDTTGNSSVPSSPSKSGERTVDYNQNIQVAGGKRRNSWDNSLHSPDQYKSSHSIGSRKAVMKVATYSDTILTSTRRSLPACQPAITNGAVVKSGVQTAPIDLSITKDKSPSKQLKVKSPVSSQQKTGIKSSKPEILVTGESETSSIESDPADKYEKVDSDILFKKAAIKMMETQRMEQVINSTGDLVSSTPSSEVFDSASDKDKRSVSPQSEGNSSAFGTDETPSTQGDQDQTKEKKQKRIAKKYLDIEPRAPRKRRMASLTAETKNLILFDKDLTAPLPPVKKSAGEGRGRKRKRVESQTSPPEVSNGAQLLTCTPKEVTPKESNQMTPKETTVAVEQSKAKDSVTSENKLIISSPTTKTAVDCAKNNRLEKEVKGGRTPTGNLKSPTRTKPAKSPTTSTAPKLTGNSKAKINVSFSKSKFNVSFSVVKKEKQKNSNTFMSRSKFPSPVVAKSPPTTTSKSVSTTVSSSPNKLLIASKRASNVSTSQSKSPSPVVAKSPPTATSKSVSTTVSSSPNKLLIASKRASNASTSQGKSPSPVPAKSPPTTTNKSVSSPAVNSSPNKLLIASRRATVDTAELKPITTTTSITTPLLLRLSRHSTDGASSSDESLLPSPSGFDPLGISLLKPGGILTGNFNGQSASSNHYIPKSRVLKKIIRPANLKSKVTKRHSTNGWKAIGEPVAKPIILLNEAIREVRLCYQSIKRKEDVIQVRDCVMLRSGVKRKDLPFVAKVLALWEDPESGEIMMSLLWYYRPEHTEAGRRPYHNADELFACRHWDINSVACIEDKCYVLTPAEYNRYRAILQMKKENYVRRLPVVPEDPNGYPRQHRLPHKPTDPESVFLCRQVYDFRQKRILKNPY